MTRPRIVFRGDASHTIGYGHLARLCALIEELDASLEAVPLFGGDATVAAWARGNGVAADLRPETQPWSTGEVIDAASAPDVRAVVIDGPRLAAELVPALVARGVRTVLIDDGGDCALPADMIVNPNFHAPTLAAPYPNARVRLLGRKYLLLRRTIRRYIRGSCRPGDGARLRVLVTFGASDPVGATARTLRLLAPDRPLELIVVAGPGFRDHADVELAADTARAAGHTVELVRAPADPGALFVTADAAICAAGGTLGELAYLGCPALAYPIVPDQIAPARAQVRAGLISGGRTWSGASDDQLRADLFAFLTDGQRRHTQRQRALATADAAGPRRILAALG